MPWDGASGCVLPPGEQQRRCLAPAAHPLPARPPAGVLERDTAQHPVGPPLRPDPDKCGGWRWSRTAGPASVGPATVGPAPLLRPWWPWPTPLVWLARLPPRLPPGRRVLLRLRTLAAGRHLAACPVLPRRLTHPPPHPPTRSARWASLARWLSSAATSLGRPRRSRCSSSPPTRWAGGGWAAPADQALCLPAPGVRLGLGSGGAAHWGELGLGARRLPKPPSTQPSLSLSPAQEYNSEAAFAAAVLLSFLALFTLVVRPLISACCVALGLRCPPPGRCHLGVCGRLLRPAGCCCCRRRLLLLPVLAALGPPTPVSALLCCPAPAGEGPA